MRFDSIRELWRYDLSKTNVKHTHAHPINPIDSDRNKGWLLLFSKCILTSWRSSILSLLFLMSISSPPYVWAAAAEVPIITNVAIERKTTIRIATDVVVDGDDLRLVFSVNIAFEEEHTKNISGGVVGCQMQRCSFVPCITFEQQQKKRDECVIISPRRTNCWRWVITARGVWVSNLEFDCEII